MHLSASHFGVKVTSILSFECEYGTGADPGGAQGPAPRSTKNEAPAPKFYKIEAPEPRMAVLGPKIISFFFQKF